MFSDTGSMKGGEMNLITAVIVTALTFGIPTTLGKKNVHKELKSSSPLTVLYHWQILYRTAQTPILPSLGMS